MLLPSRPANVVVIRLPCARKDQHLHPMLYKNPQVDPGLHGSPNSREYCVNYPGLAGIREAVPKKISGKVKR